MIVFPNAKINIGLNIIEKRPDGFHNIQCVFYPVGLCDAVEIIENKEGPDAVVFTSSGIAIPGEVAENLCVKAYHLIARDYPLPKIHIHLHKHIPIGAGLGGGSSDAAFFIKALNEKFELGLAWGEMHHYAKQLGSDCSFFISNRPSYAEGKGDELESVLLDLSAYYIVLVYPPIHVNTKQAYSGVKPKAAARSLENDIVELPLKEWKDHVHNDFEESVFIQFPEIKKLKEKMYSKGAVYASMSGSGSAVYGIFETETTLKNEFEGCFVWEGKLI
jgi:4-diphosphocytidyl-2-C-methyl-D-erythritol kinase